LLEVADILRSQLRALVDLPARYGGEEFAVILPNTPLSGAEAAAKRLWRYLDDVCGAAAPSEEPGCDGGSDGGAQVASGPVAPPAEEAADAVGERIRRNIAAAQFEGKAGQRYVHMTVSIGIAGFPEHGGDAHELVNCADKALYLAKRLGKNRVETYS
jgi:PleD family two-component response regulator